jgi:hypothetical protein
MASSASCPARRTRTAGFTKLRLRWTSCCRRGEKAYGREQSACGGGKKGGRVGGCRCAQCAQPASRGCCNHNC